MVEGFAWLEKKIIYSRYNGGETNDKKLTPYLKQLIQYNIS